MNRKAVQALVEPVMRAFGDQVVELVHAQVERMLEQAKTRALEALTASFEGKSDAEVVEEAGGEDRRRGARARAGSVAARPKRPRRGPAVRQPSRPACSKCGEAGHNARTCESDRDADAEVASAPLSPPPVSKNDRFARIEAAARQRRGEA